MQKMRNHLVAAIALLAALSVTVLSGSATGVIAQSTGVETKPPVEFTAKTTYSWQPADGVEVTEPDGSGTVTGKAFQWRFVETSDPRVDGTMTVTLTGETYPGEEVDIHAEAYRIENEGGAWQEVPYFHFGLPWHIDDDGGVSQHVFVGEDGYDGYIVLTESTGIGDGSELHGYIIEGELPTAPQPWSAE